MEKFKSIWSIVCYFGAILCFMLHYTDAGLILSLVALYDKPNTDLNNQLVVQYDKLQHIYKALIKMYLNKK